MFYKHIVHVDWDAVYNHHISTSGAIQVLRNADGGGGVRFSGKKALRRCKVQCYLRYEGVGGVQYSEENKALRNT